MYLVAKNPKSRLLQTCNIYTHTHTHTNTHTNENNFIKATGGSRVKKASLAHMIDLVKI